MRRQFPHLSDDDTAPVYLSYGGRNTPIDINSSAGTWVHHVLLGLKLKEAMMAMGKECYVRAADQKEEKYGKLENFIAAKLERGGRETG